MEIGATKAVQERSLYLYSAVKKICMDTRSAEKKYGTNLVTDIESKKT